MKPNSCASKHVFCLQLEEVVLQLIAYLELNFQSSIGLDITKQRINCGFSVQLNACWNPTAFNKITSRYVCI